LLLSLLCFRNTCPASIEPKVVVPPHIKAETKNQPSKPPFILGWWNVRWFPAYRPTQSNSKESLAQIETVAAILRRENPSIMFLCEIRDLKSLQKIDLSHRWRACTDIPKTLEEDPSLPQQGLAILSCIPWEEIWALDFSVLPNTPDRPSRGIIAARFCIGNAPPLTLYGVHLKSNRGGVESNFLRRERAIDWLQWDWRRKNLDPKRDRIVVLGDFNTSPTNPVFAKEKTLLRLKELGFINASDGMLPREKVTLPKIPGSSVPDNDFDHIFYSKVLAEARKTGAVKPRIVKTPFKASDHYPIFLRIDDWIAP
jgi:endonuclease/exonuclease/phosphatase family metal-dependent hydrolase